MIKFDGKKTGIFAAGVAFGTAGIKILTSKDAKKLYTNCTAAVFTCKGMCNEKQLPQFRRMLRIFMQKHSRSTKTEQQLRKW